MTIWYAHYKYFRRFGTHDSGTITINAVLLFVVLFYVYPLKFLFTVVALDFFHATAVAGATGLQFKHLIMLFGFGFASIYLLLAALYWNGLRQREALSLSSLEILLTRSYIVDRVAIACIGLLSSLIAFLLPVGDGGYANLAYLLLMVIRPLLRHWTIRRVATFHALNRPTDPPDSAASQA
jgi:hypothetical protein